MKILPELRFPDFTNNDQWKADTVQNIVTTKSPPKKLQSSEYLDEGVFPIIDQSQSFYCGYTNDQQAIINEDLPLVIFGDHTCALKMAREPFAQGADGIKILKSKAFIDPEYLYQYLTYNGVKQENYKRHYSKLKEKIVPYPEFESGEQQKIASCLSSLDELIAAHKDKLEALKDHKKGLLQNLFPQEGETVPKVRFPEFEDDGEWVENELGKICDVRDGTHDSPKYVSDGYPLITSKNLFENGAMDFENVSYLTQEDYDKINQRSKVDVGDILFGMIGTIGNPVIVKRDGFAIKNVALIKTKGLLEQEYLIQLLKSDYIDIQFQKANAGGILKFIALGMIRKLIIPTPKKEEQQKIASCLSAVDELITAQQEKIEQLQQHKKGLMQGLFPKIES